MTNSLALSLASVSSGVEDTDELSDADLEQVVGGLARIWQAGAATTNEPLSTPLSVSPLGAIETLHRIPA
jgi:hypothetical protein